MIASWYDWLAAAKIRISSENSKLVYLTLRNKVVLAAMDEINGIIFRVNQHENISFIAHKNEISRFSFVA